jgi:hypothetical protein
MNNENVYMLRNGHMVGFSSVIYSAVDAMINNYFVRQFPKNYFKKVEIASTSPGMNSDSAFMDKDPLSKRPKLRVNYTIDADEDNTSLSTPDNMRLNNVSILRRSGYPTFFNDKLTGLQIMGPYSRIKVSMEVEMIVESALAQQDLIHYMKKIFKYKVPSFVSNFKYEFEIPSNFMDVLSMFNDMDMSTPTEAKNMLTYLNTHSCDIPVLLQRQGSTGRNKYFFQVTNDRLMLQINDAPQGDQGERIGKTSRDYRINLNMDMEIPIVEDFIMVIPNVVDGQSITIEENDQWEAESDYVYKNVFVQADFPSYIKKSTKPGDVYFKIGLTKSQAGNEEYDAVDLSEHLTDLHFKVVNDVYNRNLDHLDALFKVAVVEDYSVMDPGLFKVVYVPEEGLLVVQKKDESDFDNSKIYTIALYYNKFIFNSYMAQPNQ